MENLRTALELRSFYQQSALKAPINVIPYKESDE